LLDFFLFMFFSVLETSSLFYLAFKIFKIDLYAKEIVFASLIMGFISYVIRFDYGLTGLDVFIQYILIFCFLWLLFRIHIFYAVIMTGTAYQAYMVIQTFLYLLGKSMGLYSLSFPFVTLAMYGLQLLTVVIISSIAYYIGRKRKGFDFIPDKTDAPIYAGRQEKILFALAFPSIIVVFLMVYILEHANHFFFLIPLCYALLLFGYLYLSNKKDRGDVQ